jgi:predicted CoA-binding protein
VITKETLENFYKKKKIAVIGVSRKKQGYGYGYYQDLLKRGYDAVPVNPNADEIDGKKCYTSIKDVPKDVEGAVSVTPPNQQETIVQQAAEAGIKDIWIHEHVMKGVTNTKVFAIAENNGMNIISGFCPYMFMPKHGFPHNMHKAIMGAFGALPK